MVWLSTLQVTRFFKLLIRGDWIWAWPYNLSWIPIKLWMVAVSSTHPQWWVCLCMTPKIVWTSFFKIGAARKTSITCQNLHNNSHLTLTWKMGARKTVSSMREQIEFIWKLSLHDQLGKSKLSQMTECHFHDVILTPDTSKQLRFLAPPPPFVDWIQNFHVMWDTFWWMLLSLLPFLLFVPNFGSCLSAFSVFSLVLSCGDVISVSNAEKARKGFEWVLMTLGAFFVCSFLPQQNHGFLLMLEAWLNWLHGVQVVWFTQL